MEVLIINTTEASSSPPSSKRDQTQKKVETALDLASKRNGGGVCALSVYSPSPNSSSRFQLSRAVQKKQQQKCGERNGIVRNLRQLTPGIL